MILTSLYDMNQKILTPPKKNVISKISVDSNFVFTSYGIYMIMCIGIALYRGVTGKFFWGAKSFFLIFFLGVKCFFPIENFHFGRPKTNFCHFEKWKAKKKRVLSFFWNYSLLPFSIFLLFFSIFPSFPFFPNRSAEISRSEVSGGKLYPLPVMPLAL